MQEHVRHVTTLHLSGMEGKRKIARIACGLRCTHHFNIGFLHIYVTQLSHIPPVIVMLLSWLINDHHVYH